MGLVPRKTGVGRWEKWPDVPAFRKTAWENAVPIAVTPSAAELKQMRAAMVAAKILCDLPFWCTCTSSVLL